MFHVISQRQFLTRSDLVIGSLIAVVMGMTFIKVGGTPLEATFIPSLLVAWLIFLGMYRKKQPLPKGTIFIPLFLIGISWQFLHFNEEFLTGFPNLFPVLYGVAPYSHAKFVTINMVSYFLFTVACLLVFTKQLRFLLVPVLFFIMAGALGNAVWHTWWVIWFDGYFPGFITAQLYWIIGFVLLSTLISSRKATLGFIALLVCVLLPSLTYLASPEGVGVVRQHLPASNPLAAVVR